MSVNFSTLESVVALGVWGLLGAGQRVGVHVTAGMQFKNLLDLFSRLATGFASETGDSVLQQDIKAFRRAASALADRRNSILHAMWVNVDPHSEHPYRMKHGRSLPHFEEFPVTDVGDIADEIKNCYADFARILGRIPHLGPPEGE